MVIIGDILLDNPDSATRFVEMTTLPSQVCDRCHNLLHHNQGVSAPSPTIESIRALLEESPHKSNRVYHIVDAADFPMSLIPNIYDALDLQEQRSRNRRSKTEKYKGGKKMTTISFVITRSDLLAAKKEQVDSMMQRFRKVLLDVLGMKKGDVRLGNVHMISAHRGWWTKNVKEEIREHGGGIWVVGKANVGKSSFISSCFPKDSKNLEKVAELLQHRQEAESLEAAVSTTTDDSVLLNEDSLLPPAPREELYPTLPVISSLPGTTVSPIRIPFGHGKGEMIDLPGLDRGTLQDFIKDEHKNDLIMTKRVEPERITIKPGQSLLLGGGLIRITPVTGRPSSTTTTREQEEEGEGEGKEGQEAIVLAACFVPLETHVTKTSKAIEIQSQLRPYNPGDQTNNKGKTIIKDGVLDHISSAGIFELDTDVTHNHLPILVKKRLEDQGIKPPPLPYKVLSRDILIEGCGWIELTAQIRARTTFDKKNSDNGSRDVSSSSSPPVLPSVEIFSPNGQHIASRAPMETWNFIHEKKLADKRKTKGGPRRGRQNISQKKRANHGGKV
jgi:ribosome biogenesis GTPase A